MYLSNEEVRLLDTAVKYFEVGFRSYIAEVIIQKYDTIEKYRAAINSKKSTFNGGSAILSGRINALLSNLSQERQIKKVYKLLSETNNNCKNNIKGIKNPFAFAFFLFYYPSLLLKNKQGYIPYPLPLSLIYLQLVM